jgi:multiple sugar transport system substrate-binding protein
MAKERKLSRRDFLKATAAASGAAALSAVGVGPVAASTKRIFPPTVIGQPFSGKTLRVHNISGGNYDELYKIVPQWEEQTGAKVEVVFQGDGFETDKRLVQDFAAGTVDYDVCWDHSSFFSQYVKAEGLEPLDAYWSEDELADFIPAILNAGRRDGSLWLIPRLFDMSALNWRTDWMTEDQVPTTWDEFKALAIQLTKDHPGKFGTQFAGKEEALTGRFYEVLLAEGGKLLDENWEPVFNSAQGVKAATMFAELYSAGAMPPDMLNYVWDDVANNWVQGLIGMYTEWYGWYSYFQDPNSSQVAGKFDLARQPMGDGGIHSGWSGDHGFSITKASKEKEMAASYIKFLTTAQAEQIEADLGNLMPRQSLWDTYMLPKAKESPNPLDYKRLQLALLQAQEDYVTPPLIAEWLPLSNLFYPIMQQIILGDVSPQSGLDDAVSQVHDMMSAAGYY